jgi:hypothetical protein
VRKSTGEIININDSIILNPGEYFYLDNPNASGAIQFSSLDFPGNSDYDELLNLYSKAKYTIYFGISTANVDYLPNSDVSIYFYVNALTTTNNWYVNTVASDAEENCNKNTTGYYERYGITLNNFGNDARVAGVYISQTKRFDSATEGCN